MAVKMARSAGWRREVQLYSRGVTTAPELHMNIKYAGFSAAALDGPIPDPAIFRAGRLVARQGFRGYQGLRAHRPGLAPKGIQGRGST